MKDSTQKLIERFVFSPTHTIMHHWNDSFFFSSPSFDAKIENLHGHNVNTHPKNKINFTRLLSKVESTLPICYYHSVVESSQAELPDVLDEPSNLAYNKTEKDALPKNESFIKVGKAF